LIDFIFIFS